MNVHEARRAAYSAKMTARAAGATKQEATEAAKAAWDATVNAEEGEGRGDAGN